MRDIATKVDNTTTLSASDFNSMQVEQENAATTSDQTLDVAGGPDTLGLNMLGAAMAGYGSAAWGYDESGTANAHVVGLGSNLTPVFKYYKNMMVAYLPGNANSSTAVTVNVAALGAKAIRMPGGNVPIVGAFSPFRVLVLKYNDSAGYFEVVAGAGNPAIRYANEPGFAGVNAVVTDIGSSAETTLIVNNSQTLTANLDIPDNVHVKVDRGGLFVKASTYTLNVDNLSAGVYQIFSGFTAGDVTLGLNTKTYVNWFGALGDDAEYAPEIQAAIDAKEAVGGEVVIDYGIQGKYDINTQIDIPSNITISVAEGVVISSAMTAFGASVGAGVFFFNGATTGAALSLTANADEFDLSVELDSGEAATLAAGDSIEINDPTTVDTAVYYQREYNKVDSISGTTVNLRFPLNFDYTTANSCTVQKLSPCSNSQFIGGTIDLAGAGSGQVDAITGIYTENCKVRRTKTINNRGMAAEFWVSLWCLIEDISCVNPQDVTAGHGYGARFQYCRYSKILGGYFEKARHGADVTGGSDIIIDGIHSNGSADAGDKAPGIVVHGLRAKRVTIVNNNVSNSDRGISVGNPSFDADYDIIISNNIVSLCAIGIYVLENSEKVEILGNTVINSSQMGIAVQDSNKIQIRNNRVLDSSDGTHGLINVFVGTNIEISGNTIKDSSLYGIALGTVVDSSVHNNIISGSLDRSINGNTLTGRIRIVGNEITQSSADDVVYLSGATSGSIVKGNVIVGDTSVVIGIRVIDSLDPIIKDNDIATVTQAIRVENSTFPKITDNIISDVDNAIALIATISEAVVNNNIVVRADSYLSNGASAVNYGSTLRVAESIGEPTEGTWLKGWRSNESLPVAGGSPGVVCITNGTFSTATDAAGDTDGSTPVITGVGDTSDFFEGDWVTVSAGFPSAATPYKIIALTASTITLDTNSDAVQSNVTVVTVVPTFRAMAVLAA